MDNGIPVVAREMLFASMTETTKMNSVKIDKMSSDVGYVIKFLILLS